MKLIETLGRFAESARVQKVISALIVLNALTLGMQTVPELVQSYGPILEAFDHAVLAVFVAEVSAKLFWRRGSFSKAGGTFSISLLFPLPWFPLPAN